MQIEQLLQQRILILDGAMGTMIQQRQLDEAAFRGERFKDWKKDLKGHNDLLNLTQPAIIEEIHRQYLEAGADIVETNTFNSQAISLADYQMESLGYELAKAGAECARRAVAAGPSGRSLVAGALWPGAIGPTTKTSSISTDVNNSGARGTTYDELVTAYYDQVRGLVDGGVDLLLVETIFDTLNAKAAFFAIEQFFDDRRATRSPHGLGDVYSSRQQSRGHGPNDRSLLEFHLACALAQRRHELRAWARRKCAR